MMHGSMNIRSESKLYAYGEVRKVWKIRQVISKHTTKLISNTGLTDAS
jgi:hypothetical protein